MRITARFEKTGAARFVSHLDVQRLFQRAMRRAFIPAAYSQGFNPHPLLAFATALSVGYTSSAEWLDIRLEKEMSAEAFIEQLNAVLPSGFRVLQAQAAEDSLSALSALMCSAEYTVTFSEHPNAESIQKAANELLSGEIVVNKNTRAGRKDVNIRPQLYHFELIEPDKLKIIGESSAQGSLNIELLMKAFFVRLGETFPYTVHRDALYSESGLVMPKDQNRI